MTSVRVEVLARVPCTRADSSDKNKRREKNLELVVIDDRKTFCEL